jgi:murein DD-endopeptidase MepM/ murein hydrolase activator NlpD
VVAPGQTIYSIARDSGVPIRALIDANRLKPPFSVAPGQRLVLPAARYHIVQRGDTLYGISRKYDVAMRAIIRANDIPPPYGIVVGQRLKLPTETRTVAVAATAPQTVADDRGPVTTSALPPPEPVSDVTPAAATSAAPAAPKPDSAPVTNLSPPDRTVSLPPPDAPTTPAPAGGGQFLWPVRGRVLLGFGTRAGGLHNDGINNAAPEGAAVHAAADGVVAYAGNELQGFGNLLLIRHAGDMMTAYAHNSTILVHRGEHVRRGQVIARVGHTGNVSSPQLHFEVRRHDKPVDPTEYLARLAASR